MQTLSSPTERTTVDRRARSVAAGVAAAALSLTSSVVAADEPAQTDEPFAATTSDEIESDEVESLSYELVVDLDDPAARDRAEQIALSEGATVTGRAPGVVQIEVPPPEAPRLRGAMITAGVTLRTPVRVDARPEDMPVPQEFGPTNGGADDLTNALAWHTKGITGTGVRIGVIDYFDTMYWDVAEHGPLPLANVNALCLDHGANCTSEFYDAIDRGGEYHGVAVLEAIRDMAPGAEVFIGQVATVSDYQAMVDWFVANGIEVISRSLGSRYDGPGDGRGSLDEVADDATARGVLWVNSGGNSARDKYYREPVRVQNGRVLFGPSGNDMFLDLRGCARLAGVRWANDWDLPAEERTDYDIYLWESPIGSPASGVIIDSGRLRQRSGASPLEHLGADHCNDPATTRLYLEVRLIAGDPTGDVIEVLDYGSGIGEYTQSAYSSTVSVVASDNAGVLAVGAMSGARNGTIASYSSRGPTNDGRIAPDLAAPSEFYSSVFNGAFGGTSAAAPVVAGAAALMLDAGLAERAGPLGDLVRHFVEDRGDPGPDNVFGHGELRLPDPPAEPLDTDPSVFNPLDIPLRVLDTRPDTAKGPSELTGEMWRGEIVDLPIVAEAGLPAGDVTAVAVNVVSVSTSGPGYVQLLPTLQAAVGGFSTLNIDEPVQVRANFAIVPVGADGSVSVRSLAGGHLVVDLVGWFESAPTAERAGRFVELADAERVMDTRNIAPHGPLESGEIRSVPLPSGVDPTLIGALVVTVTTTDVTDRGWVQILPADQPGAVGKTSTLNVSPNDTVANAAIVTVGDGGVVVTSWFGNDGSASVIVDVVGYMTSDAAPADTPGRFVSLRPARAYDSRDLGGLLGDAETVTVDAATVGVPGSATAVVWNITAVAASRRGRAVGWATGNEMPPTSNLNWTGSRSTRAAAAIIAVGGASSTFIVDDGPLDSPDPLAHLIADVSGYFT